MLGGMANLEVNTMFRMPFEGFQHYNGKISPIHSHYWAGMKSNTDPNMVFSWKNNEIRLLPAVVRCSQPGSGPAT